MFIFNATTLLPIKSTHIRLDLELLRSASDTHIPIQTINPDAMQRLASLKAEIRQVANSFDDNFEFAPIGG
jgi:hypothetical protein